MRRDPAAGLTTSRLTVRVTPRSSRVGHEWEPDGALHVWLTAPAVEHAANRALITYLAKLFRINPSGISIVQGQKGRRKILAIPTDSLSDSWPTGNAR